MRFERLLFGACLAMLLAIGSGRAQEENDPLEPVNRAVFQFNRTFDGLILKPVSLMYDFAVPNPGKTGVRNFLDNLRSPVTFVNDLLQGDRERAGNTLGRFMINTIFGLGLFDVASEAGFPKHYEDFGQTLGVWGLREGPYLVLPFFGPSNARDAGGLVVDSFVFDPLAPYNPVGLDTSLHLRLGRTGVDAVDWRYRLGSAIDDLYANSLDPYATFRTVYRQRRAAEIRNRMPDEQSQEDYDAIFQEDGEP